MSRAYYPYDTSQPASQPLPMQMPIPEVNFVSGAPLLSPDTINDPDKSCWSASAKKSNAPSKKDMPKHWRNEFPGIPRRIEPLLQIIFAGLCWAVFARIDLQRQWEVLIGPKEKFDKDQTRLAGILNSWLVTAGLLLASSATFITTTPPTNFIDYNGRGAYLCLWLSFGLMLGGLIVGSLTMLAISSCSQDHYRYTVMSTKVRLCAFLVMRCYPLLSIMAAAAVNFVGLLIAGWTSPYPIVKVGAAVCLAIPMSLVVFLYIASGENRDSNIGEVRPRLDSDVRPKSDV